MAPVEAYRKKIKDEKRAAILEAALKEFLEHGYECTSLQTIARTAGVSSGTLFNHFKSKAALFGEMMEQFWEVDPASQKKPIPPLGNVEAGLREIARDYARLLKLPHTMDLFRVIIAEAPRFPEMGQALFEKGKAPYLQRLHEYLTSETKAGRLQVKQVPLAAKQFLGMVSSVIFWPGMLLMDHKVSAPELENTIEESIQTFLARYGVEKAPPPKKKPQRKK